MIAAMAQWEREEIAERVAASIPIRAKMGKPIGGKPPFGYRREGDKVVPHPDEAPVRKLLYELYIEHRRKKSVARILNERGYRTSNGSKFTNTTVNRLIADPTAKGILRVNYSKADPSGTGRVVLKPESEWVIHQIEPIVSEETWNRANAIRESTKRKPNTRKPVHLFAGLVHCHCGAKMYVPSRNPRYVCWTCKNRIPVEDLEAIYHAQLKGFLFSEEQITRYREDQDAAMNERQEKIALLERERDAVKRGWIRYTARTSTGASPPRPSEAGTSPLEERLNQLRTPSPPNRLLWMSSASTPSQGRKSCKKSATSTPAGRRSPRRTSGPSWRPSPRRSSCPRTKSISASTMSPDTPPPSSSPGGNGRFASRESPPEQSSKVAWSEFLCPPSP